MSYLQTPTLHMSRRSSKHRSLEDANPLSSQHCPTSPYRILAIQLGNKIWHSHKEANNETTASLEHGAVPDPKTLVTLMKQIDSQSPAGAYLQSAGSRSVSRADIIGILW